MRTFENDNRFNINMLIANYIYLFTVSGEQNAPFSFVFDLKRINSCRFVSLNFQNLV